VSRRAVERKFTVPRTVELDLLLSALPHPVLVLGDNNQIVYSNAASEGFLSISTSMLSRMRLDAVVAFGCPLLALVEQVRNTGSSVNEYAVEMASPKFHSPKLVDVYAGPIAEDPNHIVMLQERTMATRSTASSPIAAPRARSAGWPPCWRTRSRTRCPASAARRSCSRELASDEDRALTR
jgi:two-component system, NtrC family, nitrogen regulation sensor histidine kinase GlnL